MGRQLARFTDVRFAIVLGGLSLKVQEAELRSRPDIVVATPGRLIDLLRNTHSFDLEDLEVRSWPRRALDCA
jgi:ATP-dependent RNA helicase DDX27